jgi:hypothetical protein
MRDGRTWQGLWSFHGKGFQRQQMLGGSCYK